LILVFLIEKNETFRGEIEGRADEIPVPLNMLEPIAASKAQVE
jgi:hypothetical protein